MNTNDIAARVELWHKRNHPLWPVVYARTLERGQTVDLYPLPGTLRATWHIPLAVMPWPRGLLDGGQPGPCVIESVLVAGVPQTASGPPGTGWVLSPDQANLELPVAWQAFEMSAPLVLRVSAITDAFFALALQCALYTTQQGES